MSYLKSKSSTDNEFAYLPTFVHVVNRSLQENSAIRRCFLVDEIPVGALPRYDTDGPAFMITNGIVETVNKMVLTGYLPSWEELLSEAGTEKEVIIKCEELALRMSGSPLRTQDQVERAAKLASQSFVQKENEFLISLLSHYREDQIVSCEYKGYAAGVNHAFRLVEQHDLEVSRLVTNRRTYKRLCDLDGISPSKIIDHFSGSGCLAGHVYTADVVLVEDKRLDHVAYCLSSPENVGVMPIMSDLAAMSDPSIRGISVYYEAGFTFLREYAVSRIEFF